MPFLSLDPVAVGGGITAIVAVMTTGYAYFRSSAVKVWEQNSEAYRARVELLEQQNKDLVAQISWLEQRIHELESRPNWEQVVALVGGAERNIIAAVAEMRAEASRQHTIALTEIASASAERDRVHTKEQSSGA